MSHKQLVEVCNFPIQLNELDLQKTNRLPICVGWTTTWYVAETSTFDNSTGVESAPIKIYKQWANWAITATAPVGVITEWYCTVAQQDIEFIPGCEAQVLSVTTLWTTITVTWWTAFSFSNPALTSYTSPATNYANKVIIDWGDGEHLIAQPWLGWVITHTPSTNLVTGSYQCELYVSTTDWKIFHIASYFYTYNQTTNALTLTGTLLSAWFAYRSVRNLVQRINTTTGAITYQTDIWWPAVITAWNSFYSNCELPADSAIELLVLSNWQSVPEALAAALPASLHTVTSGTGNIVSWAESFTVKKTSAVWTVTVNGYVLTALNETISLSANDYDSNNQTRRLPLITVANVGGATHQWISVI